MRSQVYLKKRPRKLKVAIVGFPGVGFVGISTVRTLIRHLKAEKIGEIISPHFPPNAMMLKSGIIRPIKVLLYRYKDILIVMGEVQPPDNVGQYELAYTLVELFKKLGIKEIVTIGGYLVKDERADVYLISNNKKYLNEWKPRGTIGEALGSIVGQSGLIPVVARYYKIPSIVLLATTKGGMWDVEGMRRVLVRLNEQYDLNLDFTKIDKKVKATMRILEQYKSEMENLVKENTSSYIR